MLPVQIDEERRITGPGGEIAIIRKHDQGVYEIHIKDHEQYRWGNAKEIREDLKHFTETGKLPLPSYKGWQ